MRICPNCSSAADENALFCTSCGRKFAENTPQPEAAPTSEVTFNYPVYGVQPEAAPEQAAPAAPPVYAPTPEATNDYPVYGVQPEAAPEQAAPAVPPVYAPTPEVTNDYPVYGVQPEAAPEQAAPAAPPVYAPVYTPQNSYPTYNAQPASVVNNQYSQPQSQAYSQQYQQPYSASATRGPLTVLGAIKNLATSPLFLVAAISYSAYLLFYMISTFSYPTGILSQIIGILDSLDMPTYYFYDAINSIQETSLAVTIIGMIPVILIAVGLWITFASARNRSSNGMSTAGLTMIKVISVINLVASCIFALIFLIIIMSGFSTVNSYRYYSSSAANGVLTAVLFIGGAIFTLVIMYQAKILKTIGTMKRSISTGVASDRVSGFVAVLCFLSGGSQVIMLFFGKQNGWGIVSNLAFATATIVFGVFLFTYKNRMRALMYQSAGQQNVYVPTAAPYTADRPQQTYQQPPYNGDSYNNRR